MLHFFLILWLFQFTQNQFWQQFQSTTINKW
jgi:hypothetical protein